MIGDIIQFAVMLSVLFFIVPIISEEIRTIDVCEVNSTSINDSAAAVCIDNNQLYLFNILTNPLLLFIILGIPLFIIFSRIFRGILRGLFSGLGEFMEAVTDGTISHKDERTEKEKRKYLKETKARYKLEHDIKKKLEVKEPEEVKQTSGISWGEGMDTYEKKDGDKEDGES